MFFENLNGIYGASVSDAAQNLNKIKSACNYSNGIQFSADSSILNNLSAKVEDTQLNEEIEELEYQISELMAKISQEISEILIKSNKKLANRRYEIQKATQEALSEFRYRRGSMSKDELVSLLKEKINGICVTDEDSIPDYITKSSDKLSTLDAKLDNLSALVKKQSSDFTALISGVNTDNKMNFINLYSRSFSLGNKLCDSKIKNTLNEDDFDFGKRTALRSTKKQAQQELEQKEKKSA